MVLIIVALVLDIVKGAVSGTFDYFLVQYFVGLGVLKAIITNAMNKN